MDKFLKKCGNFLKKLEKIPILGSIAGDLATLTELLRDWRSGAYTRLPLGTLIALAAMLVYALWPLDLVTDLVPFLGILDDAAVILILLELGMSGDLSRYRDWKEDLLPHHIEAWRLNRVERCLELVGSGCLGAALLTQDKTVRLLICRREDTRTPLPCQVVEDPIPAELEALKINTWEELGAFYASVFRDQRIVWSCLGPKPFMPAYDPDVDLKDFDIRS